MQRDIDGFSMLWEAGKPQFEFLRHLGDGFYKLLLKKMSIEQLIVCRTHKKMRVSYSSPVARCVRRLRVLPPVRRAGQRVLDSQWRCEPEADAAREWEDPFGNRVLELCHARIDGDFRFALELFTEHRVDKVQVDKDQVDKDQVDANHQVKTDEINVAMNVAREVGLPENGLGAFLLPSSLAEQLPEVGRVVRHLANTREIGNGDSERDAARLCAWAHRALRYEVGQTGTRTSAGQALERGSGVCQDFAHVLISLCRAARMPSRYVSGYAPGEGLMHAWVEVLCGESWIAFDPTHNRRTDAHCVFVACGRDFRDVSPVGGTYEGQASAQLRTWCETRVE